MHTPEESALASQPQPDGPTPPPADETPRADQCTLLLERFLEQARAGKLKQIIVGFLTTDNDASVRSTAMPAAVMGHISRLIERRVNREYDRVDRTTEAANRPGPRPPGSSPAPQQTTGAAPADPQPHIPRKARRLIKKALARKAKARAGKAPK